MRGILFCHSKSLLHNILPYKLRLLQNGKLSYIFIHYSPQKQYISTVTYFYLDLAFYCNFLATFE